MQKNTDIIVIIGHLAISKKIVFEKYLIESKNNKKRSQKKTKGNIITKEKTSANKFILEIEKNKKNKKY